MKTATVEKTPTAEELQTARLLLKAEAKEKYGGWATHETWVVMMAIDNDGEYYERAGEILKECEGNIEQAEDSLCELLEGDYKYDMVAEVDSLPSHMLIHNLLWSALCEVDWVALSRHIIREVA